MKRIIKYTLRAAIFIYLGYGLMLLPIHYEALMFPQYTSMNEFDFIAMDIAFCVVAITVALYGLKFIWWVFENEKPR